MKVPTLMPSFLFCGVNVQIHHYNLLNEVCCEHKVNLSIIGIKPEWRNQAICDQACENRACGHTNFDYFFKPYLTIKGFLQ